MRVGLGGVIPQPLLAQDQRPGEGFGERRRRLGSRGFTRKVGPRPSEVVVDSDAP